MKRNKQDHKFEETTPNGEAMVNEEEDRRGKSDLLFRVDEYPPIIVTIMLALQQTLTSIGGPLTMAYIITQNLCTPDTGVLFAELLATGLFMGGVFTLLQVTFGIRLPIIQGSSYNYIPIVLALKSTTKWQCPSLTINGTSPNLTAEEISLLWKPRLQELSGSLAVASICHFLLGATGCIGFLMKFVGPLTICPAVGLLGLSLYPHTRAAAQHHWGIAMFSFCLMVIFSLMLKKVKVPLPVYSKGKGCHTKPYPIFRLIPHVLALGLSWILCHILTVTEQFPSDPKVRGYRARTDAKLYVMDTVGWWFWPYPGRFGLPTFGVGVFAGMMSAMVTSIVESVGDYYAAARICNVPPPPKHAINRAVAVEGISCIVSGLLGAGYGSTSWSSPLGYIGITGVSSRIVWQVYGFLMIAMACFGKFPAALSIVPDPVIGGLSIASLGLTTAIGLSNIKLIDVNSSRNLFILGASLLLGLMVPTWLEQNPAIIQTGSAEVDQVLTILLSTSMFVGGFVGCVMDNIIPGTKEERGIIALQKVVMCNDDVTANTFLYDDIMKRAYDIPLVSDAMRRTKWCKYVPFFPSYVEPKWKCCRKSNTEEDPDISGPKEGCVNPALDVNMSEVTML